MINLRKYQRRKDNSAQGVKKGKGNKKFSGQEVVRREEFVRFWQSNRVKS